MLSINAPNNILRNCFDKHGYNHLLVSTQQQATHRGPHAYKSEFIMIIIMITGEHRQHCLSIYYGNYIAWNFNEDWLLLLCKHRQIQNCVVLCASSVLCIRLPSKAPSPWGYQNIFRLLNNGKRCRNVSNNIEKS